MPEPREPCRLSRSLRVARVVWLVAAAACVLAALLADSNGPRGRMLTAAVLLAAFALAATLAPPVAGLLGAAYRAATEPPGDPDPREPSDADPGVRDWRHDADVVLSGPHRLRDLAADPGLVDRADHLRTQAEGPGRLLTEGRGPLAAERRQLASLAREMQSLLAQASTAAGDDGS